MMNAAILLSSQTLPIILANQTGKPFEPVDGEPGVFRKELAYSGQFVKRNQETGDVDFNLMIDDLAMDHFVGQFQKMKEAQVEVPLVIGHVEDEPEKRRGTVVDIRKEPNPERGGANSLYFYAKFRDADAAKLAKTAQVSLFAKPKFYDGRGNEYDYAITHVALTDQPVIPGLSGWQQIAASLQGKAIAASLVFSDSTPTQETPTMTPMQILAQKLGIPFTPGADDDTISQAIVDAWEAEPEDDSMMEDDSGMEDDSMMGEEDGSLDDMTAGMGFDDGSGGGFGDAGMEDDSMLAEDDPNQVPASLGLSAGSSIAASLNVPAIQAAVTATCDARKTQLESLVQSGKITPAERDQYSKKFADPKRVAFALSNAPIGDGFSDIVASLQSRQSARRGERTGAQAEGAGRVPEIVADAERRQKTFRN